MPAAKYFIAIVVPEPLFSQIEHIKQELFQQHGLKGAFRSPAHITLHRPFEWKEEKEEHLVQTLQKFKPGGRFELHLRNFGCFEPRVIFVDVAASEPLNTLYNDLTRFVKRELKVYNEAEDKRGFYPHVTIAFRDLKKPLFYTLKERFSKEKLEETFSCKTWSLLKLGTKWEVLCNFDI